MSRKRDEKLWQKARARALESIEQMTEEEDAAITAGASRDPDNPPIDDAFAKGFRPAVDVAPMRTMPGRTYLKNCRRNQASGLTVKVLFEVLTVRSEKSVGPAREPRSQADTFASTRSRNSSGYVPTLCSVMAVVMPF